MFISPEGELLPTGNWVMQTILTLELLLEKNRKAFWAMRLIISYEFEMVK